MKILLITIFLCISIIADTFTVEATVDGRGYKAKKAAKRVVQKEAIKQYILKKNKNIDTSIISKISKSYSDFVYDLILQDKVYENGKTTISYSVEVDNESINKELLSMGASINGMATKFIILEEPLSLNTIENISNSDFVAYYEILQRNIKDIISIKMDNSGFKITNLEENKEFDNIKNDHENLTGAYFHYWRQKYVIDKRLLKLVKEEYSDSIAIKYKLESFYKTNGSITASISFKLLDIATNSTRSLGSRSYTVNMNGSGFRSVKIAFNEAIKNATSLQLNVVSKKIGFMLEERNNKPVTVTIMLSKTKKYSISKLSRKLKRELKKISSVSDIIVRKKSLKFYVKADYADEALDDVIIPLFEKKFNISIDEKFITINGKNLKVETSGKKIRIIYI